MLIPEPSTSCNSGAPFRSIIDYFRHIVSSLCRYTATPYTNIHIVHSYLAHNIPNKVVYTKLFSGIERYKNVKVEPITEASWSS